MTTEAERGRNATTKRARNWKRCGGTLRAWDAITTWSAIISGKGSIERGNNERIFGIFGIG